MTMLLFTDSRRGRRSPRLRAGQLAWAARELCRLSIHARDQGWCLGEVRASDLQLTRAGVRRVHDARGVTGIALRQEQQRRRYRHQHVGHTDGCEEIGIPLVGCFALLARWDACDSASLLEDGLQEAVTHIHRGIVRGEPWSAEAVFESVTFSIEQRIELRAV